MKKFLKLFIVLLMLPCVVWGGLRDVLPDQSKDFYVYDEVGILNHDDINYIINTNEKLRKKNGSQVVIAILRTFDGYDANEYSTELFRKWKIGDADKDNGVLMCYAIEDRNLFYVTGYGAEEIIPDVVASRIYRNVVSYFPHEKFEDSQKSEYRKGILYGFNTVMGLFSKFYDTDFGEDKTELPVKSDEGEFDFSILQIIPLIVLLIFIRITFSRNFRRKNKYRRMSRRRSLFDDDDDDDFFPPFFGGFGGGSSGGGFFGGGSSGGGFSGGGGSSGGGGAGGGW